jgi:hypothetical protein
VASFVIKVVADVSRAQAKLAKLRTRTLPRLMVNAVNDVAFDVRSTLQGEMTKRFDRPTRFTLNSVLVVKATDTNPVATIKLRDEAVKGTPPVKYLEPEVKGGQRRLKRYERALLNAGYLYPGEYAIPAGGARMDAYGNMPAGQIVQILSQLKAFGEQGYLANASGSKRSKAKRKVAPYFYVREARGQLKRGVWQRTASGTVQPILLFVRKAPRYTVALPFDRITVRAAQIEWPRAIKRRVSRANLNVA